MDVCVLNIDQHDIGIPMDAVREVLIRPNISPLPLAPEYIVGVTGFRGLSLPVLELMPILELQAQPTSVTRKNAGARDRVVVSQSEHGLIGIQVDLLDRHSLPTNPSNIELLEPLDTPNKSTLHLLNLSRLFDQAQSLMKPHLEHIL